MQKILEELCHGNINPNENLRPRGPKYKRVGAKVLQLEAIFLAGLTGEHKENYERFYDAYMEYEGLENTQIFVDAL